MHTTGADNAAVIDRHEWYTGASGGTNRMTIENDGNVTIENGNLVIGTAGKGIDFSAYGTGTNIDSNLLDDYEEGTWTVGLSGTSTTVANATGSYTKVGNQVFFTLYSGACNLTSSSGTAKVTGLPFTVKAGSANYSAVSIAHTTMFGDSATVGQQAYVLVGETNVAFNTVGTISNPSFVDGTGRYLMMAGSYLT